MKINVFYPEYDDAKTAKMHDAALNAFYEGLLHDVNVTAKKIKQYQPCDIIVTFGIGKRKTQRGQIIDEIIKNHRGRGNIVLERGYIKRDQYYSAGWFGLNGRADFCNWGSSPNRFSELRVDLKGYKQGGGYILICGQVPGDASNQNINLENWYKFIIEEIKKYTKKEIRFRSHPKCNEIFNLNTQLIAGTLQDNLKNAYAVVTYNSNSAVEALIEGVPAFVFDKGSMVYLAANLNIADIEKPLQRSRRQCFYDLAYAQWTLNEMSSGLTWNHLKTRYDSICHE